MVFELLNLNLPWNLLWKNLVKCINMWHICQLLNILGRNRNISAQVFMLSHLKQHSFSNFENLCVRVAEIVNISYSIVSSETMDSNDCTQEEKIHIFSTFNSWVLQKSACCLKGLPRDDSTIEHWDYQNKQARPWLLSFIPPKDFQEMHQAIQRKSFAPHFR